MYNIYIYIYIYTYIYNIYKYIILREEDDARQLYLIFKVSCWRTYNLSARYNDHQKIYSIMVSLIRRHSCIVPFNSFRGLTRARNPYLP